MAPRKPAETDPEATGTGTAEGTADPSETAGPVTVQIQTTSPSSSGEFGQDALGQALKAIRDASNAEDAQKAAAAVTDALGQLTDDQLKMAIGQPAIQELIARAGEVGGEQFKPGGEIRDRKGRLVGKVPWTPQSMIAAYGGEEAMVDWTPHRDQFVSINGIGINVKAGVPIRTPQIFQAVHEESYQMDLNHRRTAEKIMHDAFGGYATIQDIE